MAYDHYGLGYVLDSSPGEIKVKVRELAKKNHIAKINSLERKMLKRLQALKAEIIAAIELIKETTPVTDPDYEKIVDEKSEEIIYDGILQAEKKLQEIQKKYFSSGWDEFHKKYPNSGGIITLSRVGFNKRKNIAYCCCSLYTDVHVGYGYHVIAEKKYGK